MTPSLLIVLLLMTIAFFFFKPVGAKAHCDTMDGPTVQDGLKALETGNINHALKWVNAADEAELRAAFSLSLKVRALSEDARELADRYFLENLVRVHRATEGEGYTGIKPHGVPMDEKVAAADLAIHTGSPAPLETSLFTADEQEHLRHKFEAAMALKNYDTNDLPAARRFIAAYVDFFKLAEGGHHGQAAHGAHAHH